MSQSPAQLWEHGHMLTEYQVWICYRVATHQLNLYFPGCEKDSTIKRHLACAGQHEGLLYILYDCVGASKTWAYIITQWTRTEISPAQMVLYKLAALSRSAPELPPSVWEVIKQVFPDNADIVGQDWKRIWWIVCSVCVTTLWPQRTRSIHKRESAFTKQEIAEVKQVFLRQLRAVAMKEQRGDRNANNGVYLHLATELFQDIIGTRQPILHSPRYKQETFLRLLNGAGLSEILYTITVYRQSVFIKVGADAIKLIKKATYPKGNDKNQRARHIDLASTPSG